MEQHFNIKIGNETVHIYNLVVTTKLREAEELIGKIVCEFSRLEFLLKASVAWMRHEVSLNNSNVIGFENAFCEIESERQFGAMVNSAKGLYQRWCTEKNQQLAFAWLLDRLVSWYDVRNHLVHGCLSARDEHSFHILRSKRTNGELTQFVIQMDYNFLKHMHETLNNYRVFGFLGAFPGKDLGLRAPIRFDGQPIKYEMPREIDE